MSAKQSKTTIFSAINSLENRIRLLFLVILSLALITSVVVLLCILFDLVIPALVGLAVIFILILVMTSKLGKQLAEKNIEIERLKETVEERKEYLAKFSHHTRTSLNDFSMIIDMLRSASLGSEQKELLDTLLASINNLVSSVNELSVHTAQELSVGKKKKIKFDIISALNNTIELYGLDKGVSRNINVLADKNLGPKYISDPVSLKQIFMGVLNDMNIRELTDYNIDIYVKVIHQAKSTDDLSFSFAIDKRGYFDTDEEPGTKVIHQMYPDIISNLGGKYSVSLSENRSELIFILPMTRVSEEPEPSDVAKRIKKLEESSSQRRDISESRVLLVEDNPINQKIVHISLENIVKNIDTAITGKEALDLFGKSNYDMILMDIQLPIMDGLVTARKIRELEASTNTHIPIIAITANAMIGDKEKCLSAGMDEYLSKPFQPKQLLDLILKYLGPDVSGKAGA